MTTKDFETAVNAFVEEFRIHALLDAFCIREDGGPGSGNHGHSGVPGQKGGSAPGVSHEEIRSIQKFTGSPDVVSAEDAKNIESAIKKSKPLDPEYEYSRGMGLTESEINNLLKDGYYKPGRLTSWSPDVQTPESFAYERAEMADKIPVVLTYRGEKLLDKGMEVSKWSQHPDEDEVVFSGSIKMKVEPNEVFGFTDGEHDGGTVYINLYDSDEMNSDGGPGSGNFGHSGVPGQVGGSAPSGKALNERIDKAFDKGREEFDKETSKILKEVPEGTRFEQFGVTYTKVNDDTWESSEGDQWPTKDLKSSFFNFLSYGFYPVVFEDVTAEDITEQKIESGEIKPENASDINIAKAISEYQDYGFSEVNSALREGRELEGEAAFIDEGLSRAFESREPLKMPIRVERDSGMALTVEAFEKANNPIISKARDGSLYEAWMNPEIRGALKEVLVGYEFEEKGYVSTSSDHDAFVSFSEGRGNQDAFTSFGCKETLSIRVPEGTKVLDLGDDGYIAGSGEHEVILNKGGTLRVQDVMYDHETQSLQLFCEYVSRKSDSRTDEGWVTINGTHVLTDKEGNAVSGGKLKGMNFSKAKSQKKEPGSKGSGSSNAAKEAWKSKVKTEREKALSMKNNKLALKLYEDGVLDYDTAVQQMRDGSIKETAAHYYDVLEANGDPTPTKETVDSQRSLHGLVNKEYGGDWTEARIGEIQKDTGMSREEATKVKDELQAWMGSLWHKADTNTLDSYIEKAPAFEGTIHRGMKFVDEYGPTYDDFMESVQSGVITMQKNSSWSSDESVARRFARPDWEDTDSVIITCIKNKTATPIDHLASSNGGEDEVLAHSRTAWSVVSVDEFEKADGGRHAHIIVMEREEYEEK